MREALDEGAKGFIRKPYELRQMLKTVREVLD
jgi:FixJ family two-component response regulator